MLLLDIGTLGDAVGQGMRSTIVVRVTVKEVGCVIDDVEGVILIADQEDAL